MNCSVNYMCITSGNSMLVPAVRVKRTHQHTENYKSGEEIHGRVKMTCPVKRLLLIENYKHQL